MSLNNAYSPTTSRMIETAQSIFKDGGEDHVYDYLEECASYDFQCPDVCNAWAQRFYADHQDEIEGKS